MILETGGRAVHFELGRQAGNNLESRWSRNRGVGLSPRTGACLYRSNTVKSNCAHYPYCRRSRSRCRSRVSAGRGVAESPKLHASRNSRCPSVLRLPLLPALRVGRRVRETVRYASDAGAPCVEYDPSSAGSRGRPRPAAVDARRVAAGARSRRRRGWTSPRGRP